MKRKVIFTVIVTFTILLALLLFRNNQRSKELRVLYSDISPISLDEFHKTISTEYKDIDVKLTQYNNELTYDDFDLYITDEYYNIKKHSDKFLTLDSSFYTYMPSAIRDIGLIEREFKAIPIQLDHIEITIRKDILRNIESSSDKITLQELIEGLTEQKKATLFPLLIAGKDDNSFFDMISLLTVTYCGKDGLDNLYTKIASNVKFNTMLHEELGNGKSLKFIMDTLVKWRRDKLLHAEWLQFKKDDVKSFAKDKMAGSIIMRLSEHRTYETRVIQKYETIGFPNDRASIYASDVLIMPTLCSIPLGSRNKELAIDVISSMLQKDLQKSFTESTQLAPVHSSAPTLDLQSNSVRYWAASANINAMTFYQTDNDPEVILFINGSRNYLIQNR